MAESVSIPVIASGGAGRLEHFYDALTEGGADAALAASLFHYKELEIMQKMFRLLFASERFGSSILLGSTKNGNCRSENCGASYKERRIVLC